MKKMDWTRVSSTHGRAEGVYLGCDLVLYPSDILNPFCKEQVANYVLDDVRLQSFIELSLRDQLIDI